MTTAITEYSQTEAALADLAQRYKGVVFDVATRDGMQLAIKGRAELRTYRVDLEKKRVELKAPALERTRLIDAEAKRITAELVALEEPIDATIKAEESRKEREKAEREQKERERVATINDAIAAITASPGFAVGKPSTEVTQALDRAHAVVIDDSYGEFRTLAQAAKDKAITTLQQLHAGALAQEAQQVEAQARAEAERQELARLRSEATERERLETARRAEQDEADRKTRAAIAAEQEGSRQRIAEQERIAREAREAEDAAAKKKRDAQAAEDAAEKARINAVLEQQEAERREIVRLQNELLDGAQMLNKFVERFGKRAEFKGVVTAIVKYQFGLVAAKEKREREGAEASQRG